MMLRGLVFLFFLVATSVGLQAAEPVVRVEILTKPPIVPGQQVQIQVDVLAPNFFMSPPKFPLFELPNSIVVLPDERSMNLNETIGGVSYAGIRRTYVVTPQAGGDFTLPPAKIPFTYAAVPGQPGTPGSVTLPSQKFTVAGAPAGGSAAAQKITVTQDLDRDPASLKAGETLVRTVTVKADGMQAMMIPVPDFTAPQGVRLYPHDPVLTDKLDQATGAIGGTRVDRVTYAFDTAGSYTLPAIALGGYDATKQKDESAAAPAVMVTVAATAGFTPAIKPPEPEQAPAPRRDDLWKALPWLAAGLAVIILLVWLLPRLWSGLRARRRARRLRYEQSEAYSFRQFSTACRGRDGASIYRALQSWAARSKAIPLRDWLSARGDDAVVSEYERLEAVLFAGRSESGSFDAGKLLSGMDEARRKWLAQRAEVAVPGALPPLNP